MKIIPSSTYKKKYSYSIFTILALSVLKIVPKLLFMYCPIYRSVHISVHLYRFLYPHFLSYHPSIIFSISSPIYRHQIKSSHLPHSSYHLPVILSSPIHPIISHSSYLLISHSSYLPPFILSSHLPFILSSSCLISSQLIMFHHLTIWNQYLIFDVHVSKQVIMVQNNWHTTAF